MLRQATVIIGSKQWQVSVAVTPAELQQGLSGIPSLLPGHGMLFDLGSPQSSVTIKMSEMLFGLGIIFISEGYKIVGLGTALAGAPDEKIDFPSGYYPRFFLEINASELTDMGQGDSVIISGYQPATVSSTIELAITMTIVVAMMQIMSEVMKEVE